MARNTDISSAVGIVAITPSDSADVPGGYIRGFIVGVEGDVAVIMADGSTGTLPACAVGIQHAYQVSRVRSTGTTATGIIGLR